MFDCSIVIFPFESFDIFTKSLYVYFFITSVAMLFDMSVAFAIAASLHTLSIIGSTAFTIVFKVINAISSILISCSSIFCLKLFLSFFIFMYLIHGNLILFLV